MRRMVDIMVVGGGMAGMSIAAALAGAGANGASVMLVEQESQPGYHATGRSVAFWSETYGGPDVQPLTSASGPLLASPDPAFCAHPLISPRGALHVGRADDGAAAQAMLADFARSGVPLESLSLEVLGAALPGLRDDWRIGISEPTCADIDAAGLLEAYRRAALRGGVEIALSNRFISAERTESAWLVRTEVEEIACDLLVDAAGAWADSVAVASGVAPLGIAPFRRTVVQLRSPDAPDDFPLVVDLSGRFYFKPVGAGRIWLSPHDEIPDSARDVAPEELDVAVAIDRFQSVVDWRIEAVEHKWAGLRSFALDRLPVYGFDADVPGFFWFAGQGGFGIQTAPAAALLAAALLLGETPPASVAGIDPAPFSPARFVPVAAG